ncbi:MAG: tripartite tricarboxylate transporter substrate binding protein [Burkholderiaceae bacterium]
MNDDRFRQRRTFTLAGAALAAQAMLPAAARAQAGFPSRPIRMIVPFPAGGGADLPAREVAQRLSGLVGQTVVVENRPGADGSIAAGEVARAAPDGHTIFLATATSISYVPAVRKNPGYTLADFSPITNFVIFGFLLAVHESLPGKDLREILAYVRANPGKVAYGAANSSSIVTMAHIKEQARLDMTMVPYKGESQGVVDLLSGRVQMMMLTPAVLPQALKDGKCRVVCVMLKDRLPLMPEVPTLEEAGVPLMDIALWGGFLAPAGTPPDIVARLSRDLNTAMMDPDVKPKLEKFGLSVHGDSPEVFGRFLRDQAGAWKKAVALANIPIES